MKKILLIAIVLSLILVAFAGCDGNGEPTNVSPVSENGATDEDVRPFDAERDFEWLNLTIEQADELFGEPSENDDVQDWAGFVTREYSDVQIIFSTYAYSEGRPLSLTVNGGDFSPIRGIRIGDSLESALALFPDEGREVEPFGGPGRARRILYEVIVYPEEGERFVTDFGDNYPTGSVHYLEDGVVDFIAFMDVITGWALSFEMNSDGYIYQIHARIPESTT